MVQQKTFLVKGYRVALHKAAIAIMKVKRLVNISNKAPVATKMVKSMYACVGVILPLAMGLF